MGTATGYDYQTLQKYGFFSKYYDAKAGHQKKLVQVARDSYAFLRSGKTNLLPDELEDLLEIDLSVSVDFKEFIVALCNSSTPNTNDAFWENIFLPSVARFLVDNEWDDIVN
jgi:hypothetical protein